MRTSNHMFMWRVPVRAGRIATYLLIMVAVVSLEVRQMVKFKRGVQGHSPLPLGVGVDKGQHRPSIRESLVSFVICGDL